MPVAGVQYLHDCRLDRLVLIVKLYRVFLLQRYKKTDNSAEWDMIFDAELHKPIRLKGFFPKFAGSKPFVILSNQLNYNNLKF